MKLSLLIVGLFILLILIEAIAIILLVSSRSRAVRSAVAAVRWAVAFELVLHRHQILPAAPTLTLTHLQKRLRMPDPVIRMAIDQLVRRGFIKTRRSASNLECWLTPEGERRIYAEG